MPLSIGKVRVDVSLCGAVPRPWPSHAACSDRAPPVTPSSRQCQTLSDVTSSGLNTVCDDNSVGSCVAKLNGTTQNGQSHLIFPSSDRVIHTVEPTESHDDSHCSSSSTATTTTTSAFSEMRSNNRSALHIGMLEAPQWAVPARGKSWLEPVCEAVGSHAKVDLATRPFFRVGRSAGSDVQLLHSTSSRQHALVFHHPNGSCYIVDCGSSHGTFVNGVRVQNAPSGSMVVPHRVRRGSLIRFGGPGAPSFVLKSYSVGFSAMVDLEEPSSNPTLSPTRRPTVFKPCNGPRPCGSILRKRSFEEDPVPDAKRQRCVSPPCTSESPFRLVSPDSPRKSRRVSFLEQPKAMYPTLVPPSASDVTAN